MGIFFSFRIEPLCVLTPSAVLTPLKNSLRRFPIFLCFSSSFAFFGVFHSSGSSRKEFFPFMAVRVLGPPALSINFFPPPAHALRHFLVSNVAYFLFLSSSTSLLLEGTLSILGLPEFLASYANPLPQSISSSSSVALFQCPGSWSFIIVPGL